MSNLILDTAADEDASADTDGTEDNPNNVSAVIIENGKAEVTYRTAVNCDLVVAFYSYDGKQMYDSVTASVTPLYKTNNNALEGSSPSQTYTFDVPESVPEYFLVKAYLVGIGFAPVSEEYSTNYYTESITKVRNSKPEDYDPELVVLLDDKADSSFLVLDEATKVIIYDGKHNLLDTTASESSSYHFTNADKQLTSLNKGDVVYYNYDDTDMLVFTVKSIKADGTDAIITTNDMELSDAFSAYKIQETIQGTPNAEAGKTYENGLTYDGAEEVDSASEVPVYEKSGGGNTSEIITNTASFLKNSTNFLIASNDPVEIPLEYTFTWKNDNLADSKTETWAEEEYQKQKDDTLLIPQKYDGHGNGKIYGSISGYADIKFEVTGTLTLDIFGCNEDWDWSDAPSDYSSVKIDTSSKLSGDLGVEGKFQLIIVGMNFTKSGFEALVGVGFELDGKVNFNASGITFKDTKEAILYRDGMIPKGFSVSHTSDVVFDPEIKVTAEGFMGMFAEAKLTINICGSGNIGIDISGKTGVKVKATVYEYKLNEDDEHIDEISRHTCSDCYEGAFYLTGDISASAGLGKLAGGKLNFSVAASDFNDLDYKVADFYFSSTYGDYGCGTCPHHDYRLDIYVKENGQPLPGAVVTISNSNMEPTKFEIGEEGVLKKYLPGGTYTIKCEWDGKEYERLIPHWGHMSVAEFNSVKLGNSYILEGDPHSDDDGELRVKAVNIGDGTAIITEDGSLYTCTNDGSAYPVKVMDNVVEASRAKNGTDPGCAAVTKDGSLYIWGELLEQIGLEVNNFELSINDEEQEKPYKLMGNIASVSVGRYHSAAITKDGDLYMWGSNEYGQLGDGTTEDKNKPVLIMKNIASVSVGLYHSAAVTKDGELYTWGRNTTTINSDATRPCGQLGDGTTEDRSTPEKILDNITAVSLGDCNSAAIAVNGDLYTWGKNRGGSLGYGVSYMDMEYSADPKVIMYNAASVSLGSAHSAAVTKSGYLYTWGSNGDGRLGTGDLESRYKPVCIMSNVRSVSLYSDYSAAVTQDGSLYMWGENISGNNIAYPIKIDMPDENGMIIKDGVLLDGHNLSGDVVIPDTVTSIGSCAFGYNNKITSVYIPDSVTEIGDWAFCNCNNLTDINIPEGVTSIGSHAFNWCLSLERLDLPKSLTYVGEEAFIRTPWQSSIIKQNDGFVIANGILLKVENNSENIVIPDGVTKIGESAFLDYENLTSIYIPDSVTSIGDDAFKRCRNLSSITIPSSVTHIGVRAFEGTSWLEEKQKEDPLVIVNNIVISGSACSGDVIIPNGVKCISDYAFTVSGTDYNYILDNERLTSVTIPGSVETIGKNAFASCKNLTSVTIENGVKNGVDRLIAVPVNVGADN